MTSPAPPDAIDLAASYSRKDEARVTEILQALRAKGLSVWFDKNIPGGALWEETITRQMRVARAVVFFASRASLASDRCFDEVSLARTLRRPIVPVVLDDLNIPDELPDRFVLALQPRNTIDARRGKPAEIAAAILQALSAVDSAGAAIQPFVPATQTAKPLSRWIVPAAMAAVVAGGAVLWWSRHDRPRAPDGPSPASYTAAFSAKDWCGLSAGDLWRKSGFQDGSLKGVPPETMTADAAALACVRAEAPCRSARDDAAQLLAASRTLCTKAAEGGNFRSLYQRGLLKQRACGGPLDTDGAMADFREAAEKGCAIAQLEIGEIYREGKLGAFDAAAALRWITAAADQDYPPAINVLAIVYALGQLGVPEDDAKAAELWQKAAELGSDRAMLNLARALERGTGVPANRGAAETYYRRAAEATDDPEIKAEAEAAVKRLASTG